MESGWGSTLDVPIACLRFDFAKKGNVYVTGTVGRIGHMLCCVDIHLLP